MKFLTCKIILLLITLHLQANWQEASNALEAENSVDGYHFAYSVDISENFAVIGAPDEGATGTIYIFTKDSSARWIQSQKFTNPIIPQTVGFDLHIQQLGYSVAIAEKSSFWGYNPTIVTGAPMSYLQDGSTILQTGAFCTYIYDNDIWNQDGACIYRSEYGNLGFDIDITNFVTYNGQIPIIHLQVIAGNPNYSSEYTNAGLIRVYDYNSTAHYWDQTTNIPSPNHQAETNFGYSVAIYNEHMAIGAPGQNKSATTTDAGAVYISRTDGSYAQIFPNNIATEGSSGQHLGISIDMSQEYVIAGALHHYTSNDEGVAYIYKANADVYSNLTTLMLSQQIHNSTDKFGASVAINNYHAAVGAPDTSVGGSVYIFETQESGIWSESKHFDATASSKLGRSVALKEHSLLVGAPLSEKAHYFEHKNLSFLPAVIMYQLN